MKPQVRKENVLVQEVGKELVVYDRLRHTAHRLNATAASVWRHCTGQNSVAAIADSLRQELSVPPNEDLVRLALARFAKAGLLEESGHWSVEQLSRRQLIRTLAIIGVALPVVTSIVAPMPAQAQTPPPPPSCFCAYDYDTYTTYCTSDTAGVVCFAGGDYCQYDDDCYVEEYQGQKRKQGPPPSQQPSSSVQDVPNSSGLWGVSVKAVTLSPTEAFERFGLRFKSDREVIIVDKIDNANPAASGGLRAGDIVREVYLGDPPSLPPRSSVRSAGDFYRLATLCVPDCLILVRHGEQGEKQQDLLGVGNLGTNFKLIRKADSTNSVVYVNKKRNLYYQTLKNRWGVRQTASPTR
jgi:hypothetical protein